jgi:hypothetical protein
MYGALCRGTPTQCFAGTSTFAPAQHRPQVRKRHTRDFPVRLPVAFQEYHDPRHLNVLPTLRFALCAVDREPSNPHHCWQGLVSVSALPQQSLMCAVIPCMRTVATQGPTAAAPLRPLRVPVLARRRCAPTPQPSDPYDGLRALPACLGRPATLLCASRRPRAACAASKDPDTASGGTSNGSASEDEQASANAQRAASGASASTSSSSTVNSSGGSGDGGSGGGRRQRGGRPQQSWLQRAFANAQISQPWRILLNVVALFFLVRLWPVGGRGLGARPESITLQVRPPTSA